MAGKTGAKTTVKAKASLPLRLRLKAWWEGYDEKELTERIKKRAALLAEQTQANAPPPEPDPPAPDSDVPVDPWDAEKVNISQYIWGDGFCGPGGANYIVSLSKLLALSSEMSMVQLGAGLGGPGRVLSSKFGTWITGYEESPLMVATGRELCERAGMDRKVTLETYDPNDFDGFDRTFDRAMAKEALFTIEDKKKIIGQVEDKLKPGGLFLITDYCLGSEAALARDRYKEWKAGERHTPFPIPINDLTAILKGAKLQVRVSEDISTAYIEMINKAWKGADEVAAKLAKEENGPQLIQTLMREAEFWTRRKKMLELGDIRLWRILASKKSNGPSMMSDW